MIAFLTMWYTGPCWLSVLAAAFVHSSDRNTGWRSHIDHPEGTNHRDSDILEKSRDKRVKIIKLKKYCMTKLYNIVQSPLCVLPTTHAAVQLLGELRCEHVGGQSSTFLLWQSACVTSTIPCMQPEHKHVSSSLCSTVFTLLSDLSF